MDSNLNLDILPPEVVTQFLLRLSLKDLANYCQTYKAASEYCQSDAFWKDKYRYDFGLPIPKNPTKLWIDLYKEKMRRNSPISAGLFHYAIIDNRGILYMGGLNDLGQLGDGTQNDSKIPIPVKFFDQKIISVSCGNGFTIAIAKDGKTYGWGRGMFGSKNTYLLVPALISYLKNLKTIKVSCGEFSWGVILGDGSVFVSIHINIGGRYRTIVDKISLEDEIIDISVDGSRFAVVTKNGKLYFAGEEFRISENRGKNIGIEITGNRTTIKPEHIFFPFQQQTPLYGQPKIIQVSLSLSHIIALSNSGNVFVWGDNNSGSLGLPTNFDSTNKSNLYLSPQRLTSLPKISFVSSSYSLSAAITTDGRLYVWGQNKIIAIATNVKEGDKRFSNSRSGSRRIIIPVEIDIGSRVNYVALGGFLTIASTVDGMVNYMGCTNCGPP